jgi:hypothetical protein
MNPERLAERRALNEQIRARIRLIANERNLPKSEIQKVLGLRHEPLMSFAKRHALSLDWLFFGDLKGLLRMARWQCARSGLAPVSPSPDRAA